MQHKVLQQSPGSQSSTAESPAAQGSAAQIPAAQSPVAQGSVAQSPAAQSPAETLAERRTAALQHYSTTTLYILYDAPAVMHHQIVVASKLRIEGCFKTIE